MSENTQTIECRRVENGEINLPGDFTFDEDFSHIYIVLPGRQHPDCMKIQKGETPAEGRVWGWDGNKDAPTLTPSIHDVGHWHGYLRAGRLESC